jgi:hypothetical protein
MPQEALAPSKMPSRYRAREHLERQANEAKPSPKNTKATILRVFQLAVEVKISVQY